MGPNIDKTGGNPSRVRLLLSITGLNTEHAKERLQRHPQPRETNPFRVPLDLPVAELPPTALPPPPPPCFLLFFVGADAPAAAVEEDLRFLLPLSLLPPLEFVVQPPALRSASARRVHPKLRVSSLRAAMLATRV